MKRAEQFIFNACKKAKLQLPVNDNDDVWGDDLEFDEVDKCIEHATQICSQNSQIANGSFAVPSYSDFNKRKFCASTQAFKVPAVASTSKSEQNQENSLNDSNLSTRSATVINKDISHQEYQRKLVQQIEKLQIQNQKLVEKTETKDGEISILRSQLKQAQVAVENEKVHRLRILEQNQDNWNNKISMASKDMNCLKSDNELKELEIANLKDKIKEIKRIQNGKLNLTVDYSGEVSQYSSGNRKRTETSYNSDSKKLKSASIQTIMDTIWMVSDKIICTPLNKLIPSTLFNITKPEESYVHLNKSNDGSALLFRHNLSSSQCDNIIKLKSTKFASKNEPTSVICLYPEISALMKCSEEELDSVNNNHRINKIIFVTRELLYEMIQNLKHIEENVCLEDIRDMDAFYLEQKISQDHFCVFNGEPWCENEAGIDIRRCIAVIATIANHNSYLYNYLIELKPCDIQNITNSDDTTTISTIRRYNANESSIARNKIPFLNILLEITTLIGKLRRAHQFPGVLSATLKLLGSLFYCKAITDDCCSLIYSIFSEIVFSRPEGNVLVFATEFLKCSASNPNFVKLLCKNSTDYTFKHDERKEMMLFTQDTCCFQVFATLIEGHEKNVKLTSNFLQFLHRSIICNVTWMYPPKFQKCVCISKLYSITLEILYELSEDFLLNKRDVKDTMVLKYYNTAFRVGLLLIFIFAMRIPDLIVKYPKLYSQYKNVLRNMQNLEKVFQFEDVHRTALEILTSLNQDTPIVHATSSTASIENMMRHSFSKFDASL